MIHVLANKHSIIYLKLKILEDHNAMIAIKSISEKTKNNINVNKKVI